VAAASPAGCVTAWRTRDVQVQRGGVVAQRILRQRRDAEDPRRLVHVADALLDPAEVGVGHGRPIAEV